MDEIQDKYVLNHFKERSGKQKALKFEIIDLEIYKPSAKCAAFFTSEDRILHWVRSLQLRYFDPLKDNNQFLVDWIDHESYDSTAFQEVEIKISKTDREHHHHTQATSLPSQASDDLLTEDMSKAAQTLLITIHIYLTTGVIMFQGHAYQFWAEREFSILKEFTDISVSKHLKHDPHHEANNQQDDELIQDKELLQNLSDALGTLPYKRPKPKTKKHNAVTENHESSLTNAPSGCETPLIRKRRNSFDSINGLSAKRTATVSELKYVVSNLESEVAELANVLQSDDTKSVLEDRISYLEDKITQLANTSKIKYQSLMEKTKELELENENLRTENSRIKTELQNLKKQVKAQEKQQRGTETPVEETEARDKNDETPASQISEDIPTRNRFSILDERQEEQSTSANSAPEHPKATPDPIRPDVQDDIVLLIASNGKFIDSHKFSYNKRLRKHFCPTIASAIQTLTDSDLGNPSHVIIHVGTNDIETKSVELCQSQFQDLLQLTVQRYPSSKVLLSSLLKRSDDTDQLRADMNAKLGQICIPYPNVHIVKNDNISDDHLFDNKHVKKRKIGILVSNLKDVIFNRMKQNKPKPQRPLHFQYFPDTTMANLAQERRRLHDVNLHNRPVPRPRPQAHPPGLPSQPTVNMYSQGHGDQPSYATVVNRSPPVPTAQAGSQPSANVDLNTVLGLLKLYESMRSQ